MVAELGLHRTLDLADRGGEDDLVELGHHLTGAELAELAAVAAGGAGGVLLGERAEVGAALDLLLEVRSLRLRLDEDVGSGSAGHMSGPLGCDFKL